MDRMKVVLEEAKAALTKAKDDMARYYNQKRLPAPTYKPGDLVYLDASDISTTRPLWKLSHRRLGLFPACLLTATPFLYATSPPGLQRSKADYC